ncbi:MAG: Crp/Fnr family transcriptional regulator [Ruminococcus sp.]|nr:Crp/Fnr family transcriptional regulator [Ruminococcus sp.]
MKAPYTLRELNKNELDGLYECFLPIVREHAKGEEIMRLDEDNDYAGIIVSGNALLVTTTFDGQRTIIDYFEPGDVFGKHLSPCTQVDPYLVIAKSKCRVMVVDYKKVIQCCDKGCEKHIKLIDGVLSSVVHKAQLHIEVLGKRSIRARLMTFFRQISLARESRTFRLPMSLSDLADYISADRSAMMREIKKLNDEKIIVSRTNRITLLRDNA